MLNPSTDKYYLEFSNEFYDNTFADNYTKFLTLKNHPIKDIQGHIMESIQNVSIPGMALNTLTIEGLNNLGLTNPNGVFGSGSLLQSATTVNATYPGTSNINQIIEGNTIIVTFKNTILNWMYIYENFRGNYERVKETKEFNMSLVVKDSAEIDMLMFRFSTSFISAMPGLDFAFNSQFRESKTFDVTFTYNKYDVAFLIPGFNLKN